MDSLRSVFDVDKEVAGENAQWRNPALEPRVDLTRSSVAGGADAAICALELIASVELIGGRGEIARQPGAGSQGPGA